MEFRGQEDGDGGDVAGAGAGSGSSPTAIHHGTTAYGWAGRMPAEERRQYHECLRNHAAAAGGHVLDGCCEFMPASPEGSLSCAACGCHRNFHRRDPSPGRAGSAQAVSTRAPLLLTPAASKHPRQRLPFPYLTPSSGTGTTTESSSEERGGPSPVPPRRRSRTTFTREQKEQMLTFAERIEWRIQRQDETTVEQFCAQIGVRRQALKVWMHNNKQSSTSRRQKQQEEHLQERQEQQK